MVVVGSRTPISDWAAWLGVIFLLPSCRLSDPPPIGCSLSFTSALVQIVGDRSGASEISRLQTFKKGCQLWMKENSWNSGIFCWFKLINGRHEKSYHPWQPNFILCFVLQFFPIVLKTGTFISCLLNINQQSHEFDQDGMLANYNLAMSFAKGALWVIFLSVCSPYSRFERKKQSFHKSGERKRKEMQNKNTRLFPDGLG